MEEVTANLNRRFDHAALKPETTESDIIQLCAEAREFDLYGVAINPVWVRLARTEVSGTGVKIISVAGFPLGASRTDIKVAEAVKAAGDGAHEIDMVANVAWLIGGEAQKARREIDEIRRNLPYNVLLKVIVEAGKLNLLQMSEATEAVVEGGAQFVKTSTGFFGGATVEQVEALYRAAAGRIEVKASGGIRSLEDCRQMLGAGASRLGSSASVQIMQEYRAMITRTKDQ